MRRACARNHANNLFGEGKTSPLISGRPNPGMEGSEGPDVLIGNDRNNTLSGSSQLGGEEADHGSLGQLAQQRRSGMTAVMWLARAPWGAEQALAQGHHHDHSTDGEANSVDQADAPVHDVGRRADDSACERGHAHIEEEMPERVDL